MLFARRWSLRLRSYSKPLIPSTKRCSISATGNLATKSVFPSSQSEEENYSQAYSSGVLQGRRNARTEQIDKFEDGMVEFCIAFSVFIGRRSSVLAFEDFLPEKEAHLNTITIS